MKRAPARLIAAGLVALALFAGLVALGNWQVHRRAWKLDLIAQIDSRIHKAPVAAPGPAEWPGIDAASAQYRRVRLTGRYLPAQTLVQASTEQGSGWWVVTPMRTDAGFIVLVNRGFIPTRTAPAPPAGSATVTGLLRITEPGGGFLRANDPASGRWYSRDVAAIARAQRLGTVAPYFVDADAASSPGKTPVDCPPAPRHPESTSPQESGKGPEGLAQPSGGPRHKAGVTDGCQGPMPAEPQASNEPIGGLTVISFPNNHLIYALTWYALAIMVAGAFLIFVRAQSRGTER